MSLFPGAWRRSSWLSGAVGALGLFAPMLGLVAASPVMMAAAPAHAAPVGVLGFSYDDARRQISIGLDGRVTVRTQRLSNPERLHIDFAEARLPIASTPIAVKSAKIRAIRISQHTASPAVVRVRVDLAPGFEPMVSVSQLDGKVLVKLTDPAPMRGERDLESLPGLPAAVVDAPPPAVPDGSSPAVTRLPAPPAQAMPAQALPVQVLPVQTLPAPPALPTPEPARRAALPKPAWTPPPTPGWTPKPAVTPPPASAPFGVPGYGTPRYPQTASGASGEPQEPRPPVAAAPAPKVPGAVPPGVASGPAAPAQRVSAPKAPVSVAPVPMAPVPVAPIPRPTPTPQAPQAFAPFGSVRGETAVVAPSASPEELSVLPPERQPRASMGSSILLRWQQVETLEEYGGPAPSFAYPAGINGFDLEHWFMPYVGAGLDARVLIYDLSVESVRQHRTDAMLAPYVALRYPWAFLEPSLRAGYMGRTVAVESESTGTTFPFSPVQTYYGPSVTGRLRVKLLPGFGLDVHGKMLPAMQGALYPGFPGIFPLSGQGWGASLVTDFLGGAVSFGYATEQATGAEGFRSTFSGLTLGMGLRY